MDDVRPRQKLWLERSGHLVMSDYRVELLEQIVAHGSLAGAADAMGLSYRRAWGKVKEMEENLGLPLVESEVGGPGGGQTTLTTTGRQFVDTYRAFQAAAAEAVDQIFRRELGPLLEVMPDPAPAGDPTHTTR